MRRGSRWLFHPLYHPDAARLPALPVRPLPALPARSRLPSWLPALLLALAWGLLPALPALLRGELLGQPWTDLYPSVWGLWWFAGSDSLLPTHTDLLAHPDGMGFYYSSPLKGSVARLLVPVLGLTASWNLLVVAARVGTVLAAWAAGRAWGLSPLAALTAAAVYGCAPYFHGYAVEGIVEGTDGWTLALWAWALGRGRHLLAIPLMALTILSSWYLGAAALLLAVLAAPWRRRSLLSLLGVLVAAPAIVAFVGAFPAVAPLAAEVRAAMGAPLPRSPGLLTDNPFALTAWVGLLLPLLLLAGRSRLALLALIPAVLSLGIGPWYALPGLALLRFPYRLHAATLAILALAAGRVLDDDGALGPARARLRLLAPLLLVVEGLLLSPVQPVLPGASPDHSALYAQVDGPILEIPGPVAMPPGVVNRSRPRARTLLHAQTLHGQPSPWAPDFNGVGVTTTTTWLDPIAAWDPLVSAEAPTDLPADLVETLHAHGLRYVMIQRADLGGTRTDTLRALLVAQGLVVAGVDSQAVLLAIPTR